MFGIVHPPTLILFLPLPSSFGTRSSSSGKCLVSWVLGCTVVCPASMMRAPSGCSLDGRCIRTCHGRYECLSVFPLATSQCMSVGPTYLAGPTRREEEPFLPSSASDESGYRGRLACKCISMPSVSSRTYQSRVGPS